MLPAVREDRRRAVPPGRARVVVGLGEAAARLGGARVLEDPGERELRERGTALGERLQAHGAAAARRADGREGGAARAALREARRELPGLGGQVAAHERVVALGDARDERQKQRAH